MYRQNDYVFLIYVTGNLSNLAMFKMPRQFKICLKHQAMFKICHFFTDCLVCLAYFKLPEIREQAVCKLTDLILKLLQILVIKDNFMFNITQILLMKLTK